MKFSMFHQYFLVKMQPDKREKRKCEFLLLHAHGKGGYDGVEGSVKENNS